MTTFSEITNTSATLAEAREAAPPPSAAYESIKSMRFGKVDYDIPAVDNGGSGQTEAGTGSKWTIDDAPLKAGGFNSKYHDVIEVDPVNLPGLMKVVIQQPGAHKYDTAEAYYKVDPATGMGELVSEPMPTRQTSSREKWRDRLEKRILPIAAVVLSAGYAYTALTAASTTGSLGTAAAEAATAAASGGAEAAAGGAALGGGGGGVVGGGISTAGSTIGTGIGTSAGATVGNVATVAGAVGGGGAGAAATYAGLTAGQWLSAAGLVASVAGGVSDAHTASEDRETNERIAREALEGQDDALDRTMSVADRTIALAEKTYEEGKVRQAGIDEINTKVINQNLDLSEKAGIRADESYDFYKEHGRPVIQKTLTESNDWDSQGNIDAARGRATADVAQGFENSEQQGARALSRMGVNPSSGRFMALQQSLQAQKAAAMAGAATNAEEGRRVQGVGMRQQASNLAMGLPAQSLSQGAQSSGTGVAAAGVAGAGGAQNANLGAAAINGLNAGGNLYGGAANGYSDIYRTASNNANNAAANSSSGSAGWGNLAGSIISGYLNGGMADGGKVQGPGTGTSDSVPAVNTDSGQRIQLSNGEYVVSADTVRALGTAYFDKLQAKHHKPVNVGRSA